MRVLFVHNSLPEYRVAFWTQLSRLVELDICVTHPELQEKDYGFDFADGELNVLEDDGLRVSPADYDVVVLPPADSFKDLWVAERITHACRQVGVPTVFWTEMWMPTVGSWSVKRSLKMMLKKTAARRVARRATRCIVPGSLSRRFLSTLGVENISVVVDSAEVGESDDSKILEIKSGLPNEKKVLLYFGRLKKIKGTEVLAKAFARICAERDDVFLLVCGDGECREELESQLLQDCSSELWRMEGKVNPCWRASYFACADVFVLPSCMNDGQIEVWGLAVNESLQAGVPVIATDCVGAAHDILDETVGAVVPQGDDVALADEICRVLDANHDRSMSGACRKRAEKYSTENMAKGFYSVFRELRDGGTNA